MKILVKFTKGPLPNSPDHILSKPMYIDLAEIVRFSQDNDGLYFLFTKNDTQDTHAGRPINFTPEQLAEKVNATWLQGPRIVIIDMDKEI